MDRNAPHRKRTKDATRAGKSPFRIPLSKRTAIDDRSNVGPGERSPRRRGSAQTGDAGARSPREALPIGTALEEDNTARPFTVTNVGTGGRLYLEPIRFPSPTLALFPTSSIASGIDEANSEQSDWPLRRQSHLSGVITPVRRRSISVERTRQAPPISMNNILPRRRARSHSFSTTHSQSAAYDSSDFRVLVNGLEASGRRKSTTNLKGGLIDLQIPSYRIGSPRFSDRGTAYLQNSLHDSLTVPAQADGRFSQISRTDYGQLFPAPPGVSRAKLQPSNFAADAASIRSLHSVGTVKLDVFDRLDASGDDPAYVRFHRPTGRILAATPARLIAQITSSNFLDYELLADFFLSFRCFMTCIDVLEYLFARMHWAFLNGSDTGRIVRVRTFVAMRHWILNYLSDDFIPDLALRQRFCDLVNNLAHALRRRPDHDGSDMNIVRELKKCWRRTCALFWPVAEDVDVDPDADLTRGGEDPLRQPSALYSLPFAARPMSGRGSIFEVTQIQLPDRNLTSFDQHSVRSNEPPRTISGYGMRTASIPASPMSEDSLDVLSCSVPFLRNMHRLYPARRDRDEVPMTPTHDLNKTPTGPKPSSRGFHQHKRSGSFSDALRDTRPSLQALSQPEIVDLDDLPNFILTGGLIRGLLLKPPPALVRANVPLTPIPYSPKHQRFASIDETVTDERYSSSANSVKRIAGNMRRALSSRRTYSESPVRTRTSNSSSESRTSGTPASSFDRTGIQPPQAPGPPRQDVLAARIQQKYDEASNQSQFNAAGQEIPTLQLTQHPNTQFLRRAHYSMDPERDGRLRSQVTDGSQSIYIVDATRASARLRGSRVLSSLDSMSTGMAPPPLFRAGSELMDYTIPERAALSVPGTRSGSRSPNRWRQSETRLHDIVTAHGQGDRRASSTKSHSRHQSENWALRRSSNALSPDLASPNSRQQLRRRPGGDLKTADNVRELEHTLRPSFGTHYTSSFQSYEPVGGPIDLTGTNFADPGLGITWPLPDKDASFLAKDKTSLDLIEYGSLQPNVRKSFEAEAMKLQRLPDLDTTGGVEDTLLKLEGKSPIDSFPARFSDEATMINSTTGSGSIDQVRQQIAYIPAKAGQRATLSPTGFTETQGASIYSMTSAGSYEPRMAARISRFPIDDFYEEQNRKPVNNPTGAKVEPGLPPTRSTPANTQHSTEIAQSFLLDENQSLSDISTDIAEDHVDENAIRSFLFDETHSDSSSAKRSVQMPANRSPVVAAHKRTPTAEQIRHPTFALEHRSNDTVNAPNAASTISKPSLRPQPPSQHLSPTVGSPPDSSSFAHMPFILAFDSEVIAEQLTIIEKDALDEVDWKDLMITSWRQNPSPMRNWLDHLHGPDTNGIDMVIARFNLTVKWVISEIVLTEAASERARAIAKFVHIAVHARRLRNYASMYQITLALLSSDLARLHRTWSLVAPREKQLLEGLEALCRPLRNFYNLRAEMETAAVEAGCIPFIGLYTHDLTINAQKPATIDAGQEPNAGEGAALEPLVNFERFQTAAVVVKSLLRLIEASGKYVFKPQPEVLSRCLWLAALEDDELEQKFALLDET